MTLSTVGYGDAVPVSALGRILGAAIMILGIGMAALPAGMLASRFAQVMHRQQDLFRRFVEENIEESQRWKNFHPNCGSKLPGRKTT